MRKLTALIMISLLTMGGCASNWKIHGGPEECKAMCKNWGLEFAGMVGVGNQDTHGDGATACICQVQKASGPVSSREGGAASSTASLAGPITAAQAAIAAHMAARQQQMQWKYNSNNGYRGYGTGY